MQQNFAICSKDLGLCEEERGKRDYIWHLLESSKHSKTQKKKDPEANGWIGDVRFEDQGL